MIKNINKFSLQNMLLNRLKNTNPQMYSMVISASNNGVSSEDFLKQVLKGTSNEDFENIVKQGKNFGIPDDIIEQLKTFKN